MTTLNEGARDAALEVGVNAATDITGLRAPRPPPEMLVASGVGARSLQPDPVIGRRTRAHRGGMVAAAEAQPPPSSTPTSTGPASRERAIAAGRRPDSGGLLWPSTLQAAPWSQRRPAGDNRRPVIGHTSKAPRGASASADGPGA